MPLQYQMPLSVQPLFEAYYEGGSKAETILKIHSYLVAQKALEIASLHPEWKLDLGFIEEAAWLHDIGVNACDAADIGCYGTQPYICHGVIGADRLRKAGMPRHAKVAERHIGAGLSMEAVMRHQWVLPHREYIPLSLEEIIICVADKFFSKTQPTREKSPDEVLASVARYGEDDMQRFSSWFTILFSKAAGSSL